MAFGLKMAALRTLQEDEMNATKSAVTTALCLLWAGPLHAQAFPSLLAPADPGRTGHAPRYAPVTAGLKHFGIVEPKDWLKLNQAVGPQAGRDSAMQGMPGMEKPSRSNGKGGQ